MNQPGDESIDQLETRLHKKYGHGPHYLHDIVKIWQVSERDTRERCAQIAESQICPDCKGEKIKEGGCAKAELIADVIRKVTR